MTSSDPAARGVSLAAEEARAALHRLLAGQDSRSDPTVGAALEEALRALDQLDVHSGRRVSMTGRVVFDVSDLLSYFKTNRLPTGVQRVQSEIIRNVLETSAPERVALCGFVAERDEWVGVDPSALMTVCRMSIAGGDARQSAWIRARDDLESLTREGQVAIFGRTDVLCALGTAWHTPNYFLHVRRLKQEYGVRFAPFVYDLIPIVTPHHCSEQLAQSFIEFFLGLIDHGDVFFAISEATKADLLRVSAQAGRSLSADQIEVVRLNAAFTGQAFAPVGRDCAKLLETGRFILMVATLESRKNQLGLLESYAELIRRHGRDALPRLILVGKPGFQSDRIFAALDEDEALAELVTLAPFVDDACLAQLYERCLFTVYPSFYEGWGLPVTETLCYGKVPILSDNSSLPEAAGEFGVFVQAGATISLTEAMEKLIFDEEDRHRREERIRSAFRPRSWLDVADQVLATALSSDRLRSPTRLPDLQVEAGAYYPMTPSGATGVWPGSNSPEIFRQGRGWWAVEGSGCWIRPSGAELELRLPHHGGERVRIGLELMCPTPAEARYRISVIGDAARSEGAVTSASPRWAFLEFAAPESGAPTRIRIQTDRIAGPDLTFGGDHRSLGVGLKSFFVFDLDRSHWRLDFLEAASLGCLIDSWAYRPREAPSPRGEA